MNQPESHTNHTELGPDYGKWIGVGFIIGVIVAVVALEYYGYVQHPEQEDRAIIAEFKLLTLNPEYQVKVSPKPSGKEAFCVDGYMLLRPTNGRAAAGILVDAKNRPVQCKRGFATSDAEAEQLDSEPAEDATPVADDWADSDPEDFIE